MSRLQASPVVDDGSAAESPASAPATKTARHGLIAQILAKERIRSQAELRRALADHGVSTTQATLSRDLVELRATKVRVLGCIAGDDTVLVVARSEDVASGLAAHLLSLADPGARR